MPTDRTRFVLVGTSHAGNVGAAARAIKVMGFGELLLVAPRWADAAQRPEAVAMASGATDVLERARVVASLDEALAGATYVCATAMVQRDFGPPTFAPRQLLPGLASKPHDVAFVFGSERFGLGNNDVYRCNACLRIDTADDYGSLNLAQAVQVIAYEWRLAQSVAPSAPAPRPRAAPGDALADTASLLGLADHWQAVLQRLGYFDPKLPRKLMPRLLRLIQRAEPSVDEVQILRGVARAIDERCR
ncbi:MAG: RNA methyltransferase [Pseudomonadota bacterium]|nr:RNA methyltransferase [Pseudomonadota bacterium]